MVLGVASLASLAPLVSRAPFGYDESDYAYAASRGFTENALDSTAVPLVDFVRRGLSGSHRERSDYIRGSGDITFYRRYHGPLFIYGIAVARTLSGFDERVTRLVAVVGLAAAVGLVTWGASALLGGGVPGLLGGLCAGLFVGTSPLVVETALTAHPHALYAAIVAATLVGAGMFVRTGHLGWWRAAAVGVGLAFATVEYAVVLAGALILTALPYPQRRRLVGELVALTGLTVITVWPGALLQLTLARNYLVYGYYVLMRAGAYGDTPLWQTWAGRIVESPVLLLGLGAFAAGPFVMRRDPSVRVAWPAWLYVALFCLANARNRSPHAEYVASLLPALGIVLAVLLFRTMSAPRLATLVVVGIVGTASALRAVPRVLTFVATMHGDASVLALAKAQADAPCLRVPQAFVPALHFYLPEVRLAPYYPGGQPGAMASQARSKQDDDPAGADGPCPSLWAAAAPTTQAVGARP